MIKGLTLFIFVWCVSAIASAETIVHRGTSYIVYRVDPAQDRVQLLLAEQGEKPNTFPDVKARVEAKGGRLKFMMNAGIFEGNFLPTGLHVSEGKTIVPLNLKEFKKERPGQLTPNFFLKPNGVFFIRPDQSAGVLESSEFAKANETVSLATQSGPLLVRKGKIHPVLSPDSESKRSRNGAGVDSQGRIVFACSVNAKAEGRSNLYRFAELFRDRLDCPNALYFDGDISDVYLRGETPDVRVNNWFAGILAITEPVSE